MSQFAALNAKLKEIFQIDRPDLDFGVYRILNARSHEISDYLDNRLKLKINEILSQSNQANTAQLQQELQQAEQQAKALGMDPALIPKVQELRSQIAAASAGSSSDQNTVFSHLLTFFSRYYDNGDFISQRRYKGDTYAIPYAGEEVMLHWANKDQYYTKSGEAFSNYRFTLADGRAVLFRLTAADTARENRKDNNQDRRFVLLEAQTRTLIDDEGDEYEESLQPLTLENGELVIRFEYQAVAKGTKQEALNQAAFERIVDGAKAADDLADFVEGLLARDPTEKQPNRTVLEKHLSAYTQKNTADYFIHKDLGGFLRRELDFYIKNEVMHLDDVSAAETFADIERKLRMIQCIRAVGLELVGFLASLEDFQKSLWLKKKFVVATDYCVTLDRVPSELYAQVAENAAQWQQWDDLGMRVAASAVAGTGDLLDAALDDAALWGTVEYLQRYPFLMVDTRLFAAEFKAALLRALDDLDEQCDGVLIHSDNFHAVRLLHNRYFGLIDLVYMDPPYNTDATPIVYKNGYKESSWGALMLDRIKLANELIKSEGVISYAIDDVEQAFLKSIIINASPNHDVFQCVVEHYPGSGTGRSNVSRTHEYCLFSVEKENDILRGDAVADGERTRGFRRAGTGDNNFRIGNPGRPESFFAILVDQKTFEVIGAEPPPAIGLPYPTQDTDIGLKRVYPIGEDGSERVWTLSYGSACTAIEEKRIISSDNFVIKRIYNDSMRRVLLPSIWQGSQYNATTGGTNVLTGMFGDQGVFSYPKSIGTMSRILDAALYNKEKSLVFDFFGGSGTTVHAILNRERYSMKSSKYITCEVESYAESVTKHRIMKAVYADKWISGRPAKNQCGVSHILKVLHLESYEDTLNNLELKRPQTELFEHMTPEQQDDYLMHYMLRLESKDSLLSVKQFQKPFSYQLNITTDSAGAYQKRPVDLVETFNYLLGLRVKHIDMQQHKGYVQVVGHLPTGEHTCILWRDCETLPYAKLDSLLAKLHINPNDREYDLIYINGDHNIPSVYIGSDGSEKQLKVRSIEHEFFARMFAE